MTNYLTNVFPRNLRDDRIKAIVIPEKLEFEKAVTRAKALECTYAQLSLMHHPHEPQASASANVATGSKIEHDSINAVRQGTRPDHRQD
jgi:hypothetical protein